MKKILLIVTGILLFASCQSSSDSMDQQKPAVKQKSPFFFEDSTKFADVFRPWDGEWRGIFTVYLDTAGQQEGEAQPRNLSQSVLEKLPLKKNLEIQVHQVYKSTSPYYQTVEITDTYPSGDSMMVAKSTGFNQVKAHELICVVNKPDEQVIHQGVSIDQGVITWERHLSNPTKVEYFYEVATDSVYSILGWGYYGSDDTSLAPKMWFSGSYKKIK